VQTDSEKRWDFYQFLAGRGAKPAAHTPSSPATVAD
jgi:hypothetical protein